MRDAAHAGFAMVETLVALAVIAMMSGVLYAAISANARLAQAIAQRRQAMAVAQSVLAAATAPSDRRTVADSGVGNGLRWTIDRAPHGGGGARDSGLPLEEVRVVVADRGTGRPLARVRTLRPLR